MAATQNRIAVFLDHKRKHKHQTVRGENVGAEPSSSVAAEFTNLKAWFQYWLDRAEEIINALDGGAHGITVTEIDLV